MTECPSWIGKAQERLQEKANKLFADWRKTKSGQNWLKNYSRKPPKVKQYVHPSLPQNSPYAHGFHLPEYHHDLIEAIGRGDEEMAKAIMLEHYV